MKEKEPNLEFVFLDKNMDKTAIREDEFKGFENSIASLKKRFNKCATPNSVLLLKKMARFIIDIFHAQSEMVLYHEKDSRTSMTKDTFTLFKQWKKRYKKAHFIESPQAKSTEMAYIRFCLNHLIDNLENSVQNLEQSCISHKRLKL